MSRYRKYVKKDACRQLPCPWTQNLGASPGLKSKVKYRIYHVYEEYNRRYTSLDGLPEAIVEGKQPSGVYRVYTPSRRGISGLYNI